MRLLTTETRCILGGEIRGRTCAGIFDSLYQFIGLLTLLAQDEQKTCKNKP